MATSADWRTRWLLPCELAGGAKRTHSSSGLLSQFLEGIGRAETVIHRGLQGAVKAHTDRYSAVEAGEVTVLLPSSPVHVALVGLSDDLVDEGVGVGCGLPELAGVVDRYGEGDKATGVRPALGKQLVHPHVLQALGVLKHLHGVHLVAVASLVEPVDDEETG